MSRSPRASLWQPRSLQVLVHLESILLSIVMFASFSPLTPRPRQLRSLPPGFIRLGEFPFPIVISVGAILCITVLGVMGRRLPRGIALKILYTLLGFGLSWLAILLGGRGLVIFPPLLLIVVIRGCLLFSWPGRLTVAAGAFSSFVLMQSMALMLLKPLGVGLAELGRMPRRPISPEAAERLFQTRLNASFNATLLFALVLGFVLLMVGTLLNEKRSRDRLAQANQKLRRYALLAEDQATLQERNRIAREMHDSVGHSLTAQSIQLENVALLLRKDLDQAETRLQQARQLGKEALRNVRQSVATLRSHPLQGKTLTTALQQLIDEFQRNTQIEIALRGEFERNGELQPPSAVLDLPSEIKTALYRVVQEGLTNITKHSQATTVVLDLRATATGLQLLLSDNGVGFDPSLNTTGFGLQSMAERVRAIGGTFQLTSQPGEGSQVQVDIPLMH